MQQLAQFLTLYKCNEVIVQIRLRHLLFEA